MKSLIILAVLGVSMALPQGYYLNDTPDVQAEKHRFFTLYNSMAAAAAAAPDIHIYTQKAPIAHNYAAATPTYGAQGPAIGASGNTVEVEAATAQFYEAYQQALASGQPKAQRKSYAAYNPTYSSPQQQPRRWTGPLAATVPAGLPGSSLVVQETPSVLAAKAAFGQAFQNQLRSVIGAPSYY